MHSIFILEQSGCTGPSSSISPSTVTGTTPSAPTLPATTSPTTPAATTTKTYICNGAQPGINFNGIPDVVATFAVSASDCCNQCGLNPACASFSYQNTTDICHQKGSQPTATSTSTSDSTYLSANLFSSH